MADLNQFVEYVSSTCSPGSNLPGSYMRALRYLSEMLRAYVPKYADLLPLWEVGSLDVISELYTFVKAEEKKGNLSVFAESNLPPSYFKQRYCSSALKALGRFTSITQREARAIAAYNGAQEAVEVARQIEALFGTKRPAITKHLANIYRDGELDEQGTCSILEHMGHNGVQKYGTKYYNLDAILSVGYRVNSRNATLFRRWATSVLKEYLLRGYSFNARLAAAEDRIDRRLAKHDADIVELQDKVDFFVRISQPPVQGVFYDGQVFDARVFATKHILSAKKSILLIDSWVDVGTLEILSKKSEGVVVEIVASPRGNKLKPTDLALFNMQYGGLTVRTSRNFHDRFLIIDDKRLYLIGASLKDLGWKCFAFTQLDASEIAGLRARI